MRKFLDMTGLQHMWGKFRKVMDTKQDKLTGAAGQVVGFDADGTATAVRGWSNPNLLDNSRWEQKGNIINQRGKELYSSVGYTIDRWELKRTGFGRIEIVDGGILLVNETFTTFFIQKIDNTKHLWGKVLTLSAIVREKLFTITATMPEQAPSSDTVIKMATLTFDSRYLVMQLIFQDSFLQVQFYTPYSTSFLISAAKLELGPVQTLAHQDAAGNWVLNDPPPDPAVELLKCQRYFRVYSVTDGVFNGYISTSSRTGEIGFFYLDDMRITPAISYSDNLAVTIRTIDGYSVITGSGNSTVHPTSILFGGSGSNHFLMRFNDQTIGKNNTPASFHFRDGQIVLDANL